MMNVMGKEKKSISIKEFMGKWTSVITTIVLFVFFSVMMPDTFLTGANIMTILRSVSITCVIGIGLTITIASGGFDLSVGMVATLANTICMSMMMWFGMKSGLSMLVALLVCEAFTMITTTIVIKFRVPELLATLAMQFVLNGVATTYAGAGSINEVTNIWWKNEYPTAKIPAFFTALGKAPWIILIMFLCVVFIHIFLKYTKYGRYFYQIGSSPIAAKLSGMDVTKFTYISRAMACVFICLGGILVGARNGAATVGSASGQLMPALAAVIVGQSIAGAGKANAIGTLIGAFLIGMMENGLIMIGVPYYSMDAVKGLVLIIALAMAYVNSKNA